VGRQELADHESVHGLRDGPGGLLLFKYYHPIFDMFDDPVLQRALQRDAVLKEKARSVAQEKRRLLPFLQVNDPSQVSGYHIDLGADSVYDMPRLRGDACLEISDLQDVGKSRFASLVVECKRQIGPKARALLQQSLGNWNDWALAQGIASSPAEMSFAEKSLEVTFPQFLERKEDAVATFVVLANMMAQGIAGKTISF
jgi:hypothetical protein